MTVTVVARVVGMLASSISATLGRMTLLWLKKTENQPASQTSSVEISYPVSATTTDETFTRGCVWRRWWTVQKMENLTVSLVLTVPVAMVNTVVVKNISTS